MKTEDVVITALSVKDIRFPTSLEAHGSDAMHADPDYSAPYVTLHTNSDVQGNGLTFTVGRGNDIVVAAIKSMQYLVVNRSLHSIVSNFSSYYREITSDTQLRWLGPEKGVIHLATAAILNAIWDMWAKVEGKPVWKLLSDLTPTQLVSCIDFRYITDVLTEEEAINILNKNRASRSEREKELMEKGIPAYNTSVGWSGYSDDKIRDLCKKALKEGWKTFKMKVLLLVGSDLRNDIHRATIIREEIGWECGLAMDANQKWGVQEAIKNMLELKRFNPYWIEEPTSPDDILGHATIQRALYPIRVATGEQCQNRIIFKQLMQAGAISVCQIDSCRVASVNENLAIILMAAKYNIPVCPHAGGVGLCEYVQHLSAWDYICASANLQGRVVEYVDHLHEHFLHPVEMRQGRYMLPIAPGYSIDMKAESLSTYEFPDGPKWREILKNKGEKHAK